MKFCNKLSTKKQQSMSIKINYKEYPECMFAMLAAFLPVEEGDDLRRVAGRVVFRSENDGMTYKNGVLHSFNDEPAVVNGKDDKVWYKDGVLHREGDLPAVSNEIYKAWWLNGRRHRLGGPAYVNINFQEWWENGVFVRRQITRK
jgi:hypothetical protein